MTQSQLKKYHLDTTLSVNAFMPEIESAAKGILEAVLENLEASPSCYNEEQEVATFSFNNPYEGNNILSLKEYLGNLAVCLVKYGAENGLEVIAKLDPGSFTSSSVKVSVANEKDPTKSYEFKLDYGPDESTYRQRHQSNLFEYAKSLGNVTLKISEKQIKA